MPDGALTAVEVQGGDPLVVEVILPPLEARVVEVVKCLVFHNGTAWVGG